MKCERIREQMSAYIDNEINEVDKIKFEKHIAECSHCKEEYELLMEVVKECSNINEEELPENFREELHYKLQKAQKSKSRRFSSFIKRNRWQTIAVSAVAAVLIFSLSINGLNLFRYKGETAQRSGIDGSIGKRNYFISANTEAPSVESVEAGTAKDSAVKVSPSKTGKEEFIFNEKVAGTYESDNIKNFNTTTLDKNTARKIVKNGNISLKVSDIQGKIDEITAMTDQLGGYVESSYAEDIAAPETEKEKATKMGSITIKIPADKFDSAFQRITAMGTIINQSTNNNDITKQYIDMESRLNNLKIQEKTYQDLLSKAKNVDEILRIETELNRIRTDIDIMLGDLKRWDEQVEYSTIYINLTEQKKAELEKVNTSGVWYRAKQGLINTINSIKNGIALLFVFLVSVLPYILILGVGTVLAIYFIKKRKR